MSTKYVFVTGGVVSSLGKGITAASLGRLLKARGLKVQVQKFDPYINVDPGHDEPVPARRGLRHRGRRRDRSRHRPLRALHRREPLARREPHGRRRVGPRAAQGAQGRVPRLDRAGDPAHHERDQGAHPVGRRGDGHRRRDHRDRRHGRRHRVAAVPRGDPPVPARGGAGERHLPARDARAVHRHRGRAEDEADAAFGLRAAAHRDPSRRARLPLDGAAAARDPREDRALRRRRRRRRDHERRRRATSTSCRSTCTARASTSWSAASSASTPPSPTWPTGSS